MFETELQKFNSHFKKVLTHLYDSSHTLPRACTYALEGPGKRVRPLIVMLTHKLFSDDVYNALPAAIAVEMVHTYSLVHDDMPLMDNDDYRRGRLTVHKVYNDATALLVGDALLSDAFYCLSGGLRSLVPDYELGAESEIQMVRELSQAIGSSGMVHGQALDMEWTGKKSYTLEDLVRIHSNKTGKLFAASFALGAIAGGASSKEIFLMKSIGERFGLAFQILDDLLDNSASTGKSVGKDQNSEKLTYLRLMSSEEALAQADSILEQICSDLRPYGDRALPLKNLLTQLARRNS